jgi:hypothetical protein
MGQARLLPRSEWRFRVGGISGREPGQRRGQLLRHNKLGVMALLESHIPDCWRSHALPGGLRRLLILAAFAGLLVSAPAAPPPNDDCTGAIVIPGGGPFPHLTTPVVDLSDATRINEPPPPTCISPTASRSVWYKFTPAVTDLYRISTCPDAGAGTTVDDTILAIYSGSLGCGGAKTQITDGCNDDSCGLQSEIQTSLNGGQTYYIVVWQFDNSVPPSGQGFVQLFVDRAAPRNDTCATAADVQLNVPVFGTTVFATDDYHLSPTTNYFGVGQTPATTWGRDVVYTFTAPSAAMYNIRVRNYSYSPVGSPPGYDLVLYATSECPIGEPPMPVTNCIAAANRNGAGISEEITCLPLAAFQKIYIFVDDRISTNRGTSFSLEVTRCYPEWEPNNPRTNANAFVFDLSGDIDPVGDVDYFELGEYPAGYRVFALLDAVAANQPGFQLRVTTTTNTLEYDNRDNDAPFGALAPHIAGTPLVGGPAYLRVNVDDTVLTAIGSYRLFAVVQPPQSTASVEVEPNDGVARANFSGKNYFSGSLPGPGRSADVDVFGFTAEAGDLIFLSLDGDPLRNNTPLDATLELLSQSGSVLLLVDDPNATSDTNKLTGVNATSPSSPGEALIYRAPYSGSYYARVAVPSAAPLGAGSGDYLLSISKNCFAGGGTNTPPRVVNFASNSPLLEGGTASISGTIVDPDAGPKYRVVIDWGDGSPRETNSLPVGEYDFDATHQYRDDVPNGTAVDTYPITLLVFDNYGLGEITPASVVVSNVPPMLSNVAVTTPINAGGTATLTGDVGDASPLDILTVVVNWGDGSSVQSSPLPLGSTSFSLTHQYTSTSTTNYTINVSLQDDDTGSANGGTTINVRVGAQSATFKPSQYNGTNVILRLQGTPGATYRILASENLKDWLPLGSATADAQGMFQFTDNAPPPQRRFYKAVWP